MNNLDTPAQVASLLGRWATGQHFAAVASQLTDADYAEFAAEFADSPPVPPISDDDVDLMYAQYLANGGDPGDADQCDPDAY